jgi:hypothetical protein
MEEKQHDKYTPRVHNIVQKNLNVHQLLYKLIGCASICNLLRRNEMLHLLSRCLNQIKFAQICALFKHIPYAAIFYDIAGRNCVNSLYMPSNISLADEQCYTRAYYPMAKNAYSSLRFPRCPDRNFTLVIGSQAFSPLHRNRTYSCIENDQPSIK